MNIQNFKSVGPLAAKIPPKIPLYECGFWVMYTKKVTCLLSDDVNTLQE